MALALYRKYRPRTFAEVIGQEHVTEPLSQALRTGRLNHAYLFSGPRGCGKTSSARILARSLNCEKGPTPEPCGECDSCLALAPDGPGSIDVIEIDAASHGGVDDARELRERAFFAPVSSRFKVYVIDEAHMVSTQGFNALLKLVEEPPEYVKFVFATTEPEKVLGTIRSRTHHYPFRLIPPNTLRPYLEKLCQQEGVSVESAVFPLVVRAGGGSARDSLSVLDQLIAGAGVYGVTYARAVALLGVTDVALIDEMTDALSAGDGAAAFATIDRVADAGHDPRRFTSDLLERFRDLIVLQKVPDAAGSGIIEAPSDQLERMTAQSSRMGPATLSRLADIAHNGLTEMRGTTAPRLLLELVVARMLLPGAEESHGALLQRLERMERRLGAASDPSAAGMQYDPDQARGAAPSTPAARAQSAATPVRATPSVPASSAPQPAAPLAAPTATAPTTAATAPTPAAPARPPAAGPPAAATPGAPAPSAVAVSPDQAIAAAQPGQPMPADLPMHADGAGSLDAAAVRRVWDEVLAVVRRRSPRAWAVVREAMVRDVHGEEIVLVFQHAVHANMLGAQADLLVESVREVLGGAWRVRAEVGNDEHARSAPARSAPDPARTAPATPPSSPAPAPRSAPARPSSPSGGASRSAPPARTGGGSSSGAATTGAGLSASSSSDGDWPTPATPGGASATPAGSAPGPDGSAATGTPGASTTEPAGAAFWSTPAAGATTDPEVTATGAGSAAGRSPVGSGQPAKGTAQGAVQGGAAQGGAAHRGAVQGGAAQSGAAQGGVTSPGGPSPAGRGRAQTAGRTAAGGRSEGGRADGSRGAKPGRASGFGDGPPLDEPPFDPDYDSVPKSGYEGFDPGDEPMDDESTVRETSEQQAIRVLTEQFGAERIGEAKPPR